MIYNKDLDFHIELKNSSCFLIPINKTERKIPSKDIVFTKDGDNEIKILASNKKHNEKEKIHLNYIQDYFLLAQKEMKKNKIPASIKLAQGILETNGGTSDLAKKCNNHFGIKCFSKKCKKGHCMNFNDDTHKDFFKKYNSVEESYRAHSLFLKKSRYENLFNLEMNDYKSWAYELKRAGYATDKKYPEKLINLIEKYELYKYDKY